jgi:phosphoglycerol transferase MdoB-like AlkP superfamily enzyme
MDFLLKIMPGDWIVWASYIAVIFLGIFLWTFRNKSKRTQWIVRILFLCIFLILVLCKIFIPS